MGRSLGHRQDLKNHQIIELENYKTRTIQQNKPRKRNMAEPQSSNKPSENEEEEEEEEETRNEMKEEKKSENEIKYTERKCKIKIIKKKNAKIRPCIESIDNDRPFGTRSI